MVDVNELAPELANVAPERSLPVEGGRGVSARVAEVGEERAPGVPRERQGVPDVHTGDNQELGHTSPARAASPRWGR